MFEVVRGFIRGLDGSWWTLIWGLEIGLLDRLLDRFDRSLGVWYADIRLRVGCLVV